LALPLALHLIGSEAWLRKYFLARRLFCKKFLSVMLEKFDAKRRAGSTSMDRAEE
jgi:hypothetical protein